MAMSDPLGDMLTRIRNGQSALLKTVSCPFSRLKMNVLEVLRREGYIRGFSEAKDERGLPEIRIELKYEDGKPVIREIRRMSKPGRRVYTKKDMPRFYNGLGILIVSTPMGVLSDHEARTRNVGGEVLGQVF